MHMLIYLSRAFIKSTIKTKTPVNIEILSQIQYIVFTRLKYDRTDNYIIIYNNNIIIIYNIYSIITVVDYFQTI